MIAELTPVVQAAIISANATIKAARIAAEASRFNGVVSAVSAALTVLGVSVTAAVAYLNARRPILLQQAERASSIATTRARLAAYVQQTLGRVDLALTRYRGDFSRPVELSPLNLHTAIGDEAQYSILGASVVTALAQVSATAEAYRRAKEPFQQQFGDPARSQTPAQLAARPEGFEVVEHAADAHMRSLQALLDLLLADRVN